MNTDIQGNDIMPYLKKRNKKQGNAKAFLIILTSVAIILLFAVLYGSARELFSFFGKGEGEMTETTVGTSAQSTQSTAPPSVAEIPNGARRIIKTDMSAAALGTLYENETDAEISSVSCTFPSLAGEEISVLVLCLRGFETYLKDGAEYLEGDYPAGNGTVRVSSAARALAASLTLSGVGALYVDVGNEAAYGSFENTEKKIEEYLSLYPNVKYIIDVRRGVYYDEDGNLLSPSYEPQGRSAAQMRLCVGYSSELYEAELACANTLFSALGREARACVMPTRIKDGCVFPDAGVPVIALEIGSAVSSSEEALLAAEMFAKTFAELTNW